MSGGKRRGGSAGKGRCSRIGRGQAVADRLKRQAAERSPSQRQRRVVVKARIVRHRAGSGAAGAHLRYIQRDGTTRDGERGQLYGPERDQEDGKAFVERGEGDRHSFRFIVAPEDGDRLSDLRGFTRDVMSQMETDLGTKLDWVAVDHYNTGHPHSHVVIRGKDDLGKDLIIAQDYITDGVRLRAQERATLELGPETDLELREKLRAEITAERFTRIDRAMIEEATDKVLDLRPEAGQVRADFDRTLRLGRLQTLGRYGLATEAAPGRLDPLGTAGADDAGAGRARRHRQGDQPGADRRGAWSAGLDRYVLHGEAMPQPVIGRVIGKRLTDELGDRVALIVDGVDGRTHHVALGDKAVARGRADGVHRRDRPRADGAARLGSQHRAHGRRHRRLSPERTPRHGRGRPSSACPAAISTAMSRAMSGGWRRCAAPGSSNGSTPTVGDPCGLRGARRRMTTPKAAADEPSRFSPLDLDRRSPATAPPGSTANWSRPIARRLTQAGSAARSSRALERRKEASSTKAGTSRALEGSVSGCERAKPPSPISLLA